MDFKFIQNPITKNWVISAPRRAKRPDEATGAEPVCPFCVGREANEKENYRVGGKPGDSDWQIRVLPNKFPFAPIHEVIIHSPDHHKSFDELPLSQSELILKTFRQRFQTHQDKGQVYIFHNHGEGGGESLPHPHSQLAVVPEHVKMDIPRLHVSSEGEFQETAHFMLSCPITSQWPDEVWVFPKKRGRLFSEITDEEIKDFAKILYRLIQIFDLRHGHEFPFNFYIYPGGDWYLRLIPRVKNLGGFELGTGVYVNTQDPKETMAFIKEHFESPNEEKIRMEHQASYKRTA
jgi:UDPglucose--hexose-1-phosphate uridylyltransferase